MTGLLSRPPSTVDTDRADTDRADTDRARIGIVNLMPHAAQYESWLLPQLAGALPYTPLWVRMAGRRYHLDDPAYIDGQYRSYVDITDEAPLDGLIVSGAAVEHLPYGEVRFLPELATMVRAAHAAGTPILGLCWGALGVAHLLYGLPKAVYGTKVSGVYETELLVADGPIGSVLDDRFWSAHSRFAGFDDAALDASPRLRAVARAAGAGTVIAESPDHQVVLHVGHPEYTGGRLAQEYHRDLRLGVEGALAPAGVDLDRPLNQWRSHSLAFFAAWVRLAHERRSR